MYKKNPKYFRDKRQNLDTVEPYPGPLPVRRFKTHLDTVEPYPGPLPVRRFKTQLNSLFYKPDTI